MNKATHNLTIDRAIALHKMIRLLTIAGGGESYLNFMGNEFGHPEWIDFPREGNGWSFQYCRRQWSLADNGYLKYQWLNDFDRAMIQTVKDANLFEQNMAHLNWMHRQDMVIAFERSGLLFVLNFNPTQSFSGYPIPVTAGGDYEVVLSTDDQIYGGQERIAHIRYSSYQPGVFGSQLRLYLPARTAVVLRVAPQQDDEQA
jgi:1,4-alpha-glucan branching enzyme